MYVYYRARDMFVKLSLMSWMDIYVLYLLLMLLYALVKVLEDPLTDFMCLVFTADATVCAGKGPGGSGDDTYLVLIIMRLVCVLITKNVILSARFLICVVYTVSYIYFF